jgi:hypothetical protein
MSLSNSGWDSQGDHSVERMTRHRRVIESMRTERGFPNEADMISPALRRFGWLERLVEAWRYRNKVAREAHETFQQMNRARLTIELQPSLLRFRDQPVSDEYKAGFEAATKQALEHVAAALAVKK